MPPEKLFDLGAYDVGFNLGRVDDGDFILLAKANFVHLSSLKYSSYFKKIKKVNVI